MSNFRDRDRDRASNRRGGGLHGLRDLVKSSKFSRTAALTAKPEPESEPAKTQPRPKTTRPYTPPPSSGSGFGSGSSLGSAQGRNHHQQQPRKPWWQNSPSSRPSPSPSPSPNPDPKPRSSGHPPPPRFSAADPTFRQRPYSPPPPPPPRPSSRTLQLVTPDSNIARGPLSPTSRNHQTQPHTQPYARVNIKPNKNANGAKVVEDGVEEPVDEEGSGDSSLGHTQQTEEHATTTTTTTTTPYTLDPDTGLIPALTASGIRSTPPAQIADPANTLDALSASMSWHEHALLNMRSERRSTSHHLHHQSVSEAEAVAESLYYQRNPGVRVVEEWHARRLVACANARLDLIEKMLKDPNWQP